MSPLWFGLLLAVTFGAASVAWAVSLAVGASRRMSEQNDRIRLLSAALGSIAGICYRLDRGRALRVDSHDDPAFPLELGKLTALLEEDEQAVIDRALLALAGRGTGFFRRATVPGSGKQLELSGHRVTSSVGHGVMDLIWVSDVTEREIQTAERLHRESELGFLRHLIERLPLPLWWRDETLALAGGNALGGAIEAGGAAARALAEAAQATGQPARQRVELALPEGNRAVELVELPLERGGTLGFALERGEVEQLRGEMARLALGHQQVLEAVGTAIAIWGPDARLLFNNTAFERLWGLDHEWLASEPTLGEMLDALREMRALPEHADFRRFKAEQLAQFGSLRTRREELLHLPDERTLRLTITRHPFGGLTFCYEDVTDRLALERSFNTLAAVQRETLDNLFEGIAVFGSDGRLKLWNPVYGALWELTPADLAGHPHIAALVEKARPLYDDGQDWPETKRAVIELVTAHSPFAERIERRDGSVLEFNAVPLPDGDILLTYLDVTDTARVQRALQEKNEALETATRLKSEFIANVSYELRTPLNAIIGFAEILANQYFGPLNERQLDYARGVLDSSQRLLSLINDILDLATIEAGQLTLEREPVDIHALLASILALTRERARRLDLTLGFDCPPDIGLVVMDEKRIRQALFNLVSNAIKFTPANGTVVLSARRQNDEVALIVADTGVGIAPEHLHKVWDKFERGDPSSRAVGAGLGLSLVKSFVELHGGRVELESAPDQGTKVTCWLPVANRVTVRPPARRRTDARAAVGGRPPVP